MKKRIINILKLIVFANLLFNANNIALADTLKIHVLGYNFKGETYEFFYKGKMFKKKVKSGTDAFAFLIYLPDTIKDLQRINLKAYRKSRLGFRYKDTKLELYYDSRRKYLVFLRDYKIKDCYSFSVRWTDETFFVVQSIFWKVNYIPEWAKCDSITVTTLFIAEPLIW